MQADPTRILFGLETDGSLTPGRALDEAFGILERRFAELSEQLESLE